MEHTIKRSKEISLNGKRISSKIAIMEGENGESPTGNLMPS